MHVYSSRVIDTFSLHLAPHCDTARGMRKISIDDIYMFTLNCSFMIIICKGLSTRIALTLRQTYVVDLSNA